jgi:hypothetical protein
MNYSAEDYTFAGLLNASNPDNPITSLAYLIGLVDSTQNQIMDLQMAKFVIRVLFSVEEQIDDPAELLKLQTERFPKNYYPQTPVMLTSKWSPIADLLQKNAKPLALCREMRGMNCASGIWGASIGELVQSSAQSETQEQLFWHVLKKVSGKAHESGSLISIVAKPGWDYEEARDTYPLNNLTSIQVAEAGRVIWQRTPRKI